MNEPTDEDDVASDLRALVEDARAFGVEDFASEATGGDENAGDAADALPVDFDRVAPSPGAVEGVSVAAATSPAEVLRAIGEEVAACRRCPLGSLRTCVVPGQGASNPEFMFVGEAPGAEEDASGLAFVGAAGKLLTKMIAAMGLARDEVFIGNVLKCRPPGNRAPEAEEVAQCLPYLERQIAALKPRVICALGAHAARAILRVDASIGALRGRTHQAFGAEVVATYHPAYLLRSPEHKAAAWDDLKRALKIVGREPPPRAPA